MERFNGKLTSNYIEILKNNGFSDRDIHKIEKLLYNVDGTLINQKNRINSNIK